MVPTDGGVTRVSRSPLEKRWRPADWEVRQLLTFAYGVGNVSRLAVAGCFFGYDSTLLSSLSCFFFYSVQNLFAIGCYSRRTSGRHEQKVVLFTLRKKCAADAGIGDRVNLKTAAKLYGCCVRSAARNADLPLSLLVGDPST